MPGTVLLVEDDPDVGDDVAYMLERRGHAVRRAKNGQEALDSLLDGYRPDVVLLDLMMPEMDGWTLRVELLKRSELAHLPVIVLSGTADVADQADVLLATDYVPKPVDLPKLYSLVDKYSAPRDLLTRR